MSYSEEMLRLLRDIHAELVKLNKDRSEPEHPSEAPVVVSDPVLQPRIRRGSRGD